MMGTMDSVFDIRLDYAEGDCNLCFQKNDIDLNFFELNDDLVALRKKAEGEIVITKREYGVYGIEYTIIRSAKKKDNVSIHIAKFPMQLVDIIFGPNCNLIASIDQEKKCIIINRSRGGESVTKERFSDLEIVNESDPD